MKDKKTLKNYMSPQQLYQLDGRPTWHTNCVTFCTVARPGKTARDRARRRLAREA